MNFENGVIINDRYNPDRRELRHIECVAEYECIVEGPPAKRDKPKREVYPTEEAYQRAVVRFRKCRACGKDVD